MKFIKMILISLLLVSTARAITAFNIKWGTDLTSNMRSNTLRQWTESIEGRVAENIGTGNIYYVDSGVVQEGDGSSWTDARNTLDEAIGLCTANNGDVIYVAQGHAENLSAADGVDVDVAGVTIIGIGEGQLRPTFSYTNAAGEFVLGAAGDNCTIINLRFIATVTTVAHAIDVEAACVGWSIIGCEFKAETTTVDEFVDVITIGAAADEGFVAFNRFLGDPGSNAGPQSCINFVDCDYIQIIGNECFGDRAVACIENETTASNHILIMDNVLFNGIIGGTAGLNTEPCIELVATTTGAVINNTVICNVATPDAAIVAADCFLGGNVYSETEGGFDAPPSWLTTDSALNMFGYNDADNAYISSTVASNADGSMLERLEYLQTISADLAGLSEIGDKVVADMDANSLLVNWTAARAAIVTDLAGISQIGDKVVADMDANSSLVTILADTAAQDTEAEWADLSSTVVDNIVAAMDANSTDLAILNDLAGISQVGDKIVADMDANSLLVNWTAVRAAIITDLAGISQIGDKIVADMDANSTLVTILADTGAQDTEAEWADLGSTLVDNIQAAMDVNSLLVNWTAARANIITDLAGISQIGDKIVADMDANSILADLAGISQIGDKVQMDMDANSVLYWQPRAIRALTDEVTGNLFTVTGGPIEIISFYGYVDVIIGAAATTCKVWVDATAGVSYDQDFSTAVAIEGDVVGTMYVFSAANPAVLTPLTPVSAGAGNPMYPWMCQPGVIEQLMSADPGGAVGDHITWTMVYRPLTAGVTVADAS